LQQNVIYTRRTTPRVTADDAVYALWYCDGRGDVSHIQNLNLSGLFLETRLQKEPGDALDIHFLVGEGPIHARAVVRHVELGQGLGVRLLAMNDKHRLHFGALMGRLYSARGTAKLAGERVTLDRPAAATRDFAVS
jgi:PilZ domain-containing protein